MAHRKPELIDMHELSKQNDGFSDELPMSTGSLYFLGQEELAKCIDRGEAGHVGSAIKVLNYYAFSNFDREKQIYWMEKTATLGDNISQFNYAMYLSGIGRAEEAMTWAQKSALSGNTRASELFKNEKDN